MKINFGKFPKQPNRERKLKIQIDPWDTWGMDHTLALIIHPMLIQLKNTKHGYPFTDPEDAPSIGEGSRENDYDFDSNAEKRWDWILDEMIWAFSQIVDEDADQQFHSGEIDFESKEVEINGQKLFELVHGPKHTHTFDKEGYDKWSERKSNGLKLFGKYFQALWD